jgi:hypothetical protein
LISKELNKNVENSQTAHHEFQLTSVDSVRRKDQTSYINGLKMVNGLFLKKNLILNVSKLKKIISSTISTISIENYKIYDIPENNHLILFSGKLSLYIFDRNTLNFIKKTKLKLKTLGDSFDLCFVKCLNKICFITNDSLFSMNPDYDQVQMEKKDLFISHDPVFICTKNEKIYIYIFYGFEHKTLVLNANGFHKIDNVEMIDILSAPVKSMKIINESIFYLTKSSIFMYDLDLKFLFKFGSILTSAGSLLSSDKLNNYLFILDDINLKLFSLDNFKYFGSVDINHENVILKDCKAILAGYNLIINSDCKEIGSKTEIKMFKLNFNFPNVENLNEDFMCKMNTYKKHLLKNPIELPCGNYSCLECVYDNYNLARNEFKCSFINCNKNHQELRNYCVESNIIQNSLYEICNNQIKHSMLKISGIRNDNSKFFFFLFKNKSNIFFQILDVRIESLENRFDLLENDLEIKFESFKTIFDEYCEGVVDVHT